MHSTGAQNGPRSSRACWPSPRCLPPARLTRRSASARRCPRHSRSCRSTSACARASSRRRGLDVESSPSRATPACSRPLPPTRSTSCSARVPRMAFIAKGAPIKGVAAMAGPPLLLAIVVRPDGPKTVADLKGKKVSVSTAGSLTYWLVSETSRRQGWGPNGIDISPMGAMPGQIAALKRGDIDGAIMDIGNAFDLEKTRRSPHPRALHRHQGLPHPRDLRDRQGDRRASPRSCASFPQGLVRDHRLHAQANKAETVKIAKEVMDKDEDITAQRLRRADADVLRHRQVRSEGAGDTGKSSSSSNFCRPSPTCRSSTPRPSCRSSDTA